MTDVPDLVVLLSSFVSRCVCDSFYEDHVEYVRYDEAAGK